jgi:uncharacterized protein (DUF433 family)
LRRARIACEGRFGFSPKIIAMTTGDVISSDPEVQGGTPVFTGTRVPVKNLIDYLEAGDSLEQFLEDFPSVTHDQAIAALELAKEALLTLAGSH